MDRNSSLGATWRKLQDLGYAVTSATCPSRLTSGYAQAYNRPDGFLALADHPGAIMCHPTLANGCALSDASKRQVIALVVTSYLLADPKQAKAVNETLADHKLNGGPVRIDGSGNHTYPLQWNGAPIFDGQYAARLCFDDDDATVSILHAIESGRFVQRTDEFSRTRNIPMEPVGTHVIRLDGDWSKSGHLLDTPRWKLPELLKANVNRLIADVERARWMARPMVKAKDAAA